MHAGEVPHVPLMLAGAAWEGKSARAETPLTAPKQWVPARFICQLVLVHVPSSRSTCSHWPPPWQFHNATSWQPIIWQLCSAQLVVESYVPISNCAVNLPYTFSVLSML